MSHFFSLISRLRYINRWSLMRNSITEDVSQHSHMVALIAHNLALVQNTFYGGKINADKLCTLAIYHESAEVFTGDLPTPIKYSNNTINTAYKDLEKAANDKLIKLLPQELQAQYDELLNIADGSDEKKILKAADKLSAYIKCIQEKANGNTEFIKAEKTLLADISKNDLPCVQYFIKHFLPSFSLSLDEIT